MHAFGFSLVCLLCVTSVSAFKLGASPFLKHRSVVDGRVGNTALAMGARNRAWAKGDLSDSDIFDDDVSSDDNKKGKFKLDPETVFFEGPPSPSELIFPTVSILTVIGIVPFLAALSRQFWVKYKFTSRRISIQSGFGGDTVSEIIYPDIAEIRYVYRFFGSAGDMVLFLKDGAKAELRFVPDFSSVYDYVLSKCDEECQQKSMKLVSDGAGAPDAAATATPAVAAAVPMETGDSGSSSVPETNAA